MVGCPDSCSSTVACPVAKGSESEEEPVENLLKEKKALSPVCGGERTDPGARFRNQERWAIGR